MRTVNLDLAEPVWSQNPNVIGAWSFGSSRDGHVTPGSDLDFGVLFAREPSLTELVTLSDNLQRVLGFEDIDVVVLNDANTVARFEAVCGKRLFSRDHSAVAEFVSYTARVYEDEMAYLERSLRASGPG